MQLQDLLVGDEDIEDDFPGRLLFGVSSHDDCSFGTALLGVVFLQQRLAAVD